MRITGGQAKGIRLKAPRCESIRPATDRMRESLFSSLGADIEGHNVADLFAGTGSYGLEALSRGAASVTFFENDPKALACLKKNVRATLKSSQLDSEAVKFVACNVYSLIEYTETFDFIFLDPPYASIAGNLTRMFEKAVHPIADEEARVILELPGNLEPEISGWKLVRRVGKGGKGKPTVAILEKA